MRYDAEHKQKTRARVLQEAAKAVRAEGPHKIGVAAIMAQAGLTHGGFYAHFSSREELLAATLAQMLGEGQSLLEGVTQGRGPAEALEAYVDFYLSPEHRDMRASGCPLPFLAADAPRLDAESRARFAAGVAGLTRRLADLLSQLGRPDAEALASSVLAEAVGALSLARAEPDPARSDELLARSREAVKRRTGLAPA